MGHEQKIIYREWQYPRLSSFLPLLLIVPAFWLVTAPFNTNIGAIIGVVAAIAVAALKLKSSKHIQVTDEHLELGGAKIPRSVLGAITEISTDQQFLERGPSLDARAFTFFKYGVPEMLKINIQDEKDPTPYVLISTRNSTALKAALEKQGKN